MSSKWINIQAIQVSLVWVWRQIPIRPCLAKMIKESDEDDKTAKGTIQIHVTSWIKGSTRSGFHNQHTGKYSYKRPTTRVLKTIAYYTLQAAYNKRSLTGILGACCTVAPIEVKVLTGHLVQTSCHMTVRQGNNTFQRYKIQKLPS